MAKLTYVCIRSTVLNGYLDLGGWGGGGDFVHADYEVYELVFNIWEHAIKIREFFLKIKNWSENNLMWQVSAH